MTSRSDPEDVRLRFGMDPPRLEEREYWASLEPGADEWVAPQDGLYRATYVGVPVCATCHGAGELEVGTHRDEFGNWDTETYRCPDCSGSMYLTQGSDGTLATGDSPSERPQTSGSGARCGDRLDEGDEGPLPKRRSLEEAGDEDPSTSPSYSGRACRGSGRASVS